MTTQEVTAMMSTTAKKKMKQGEQDKNERDRVLDIIAERVDLAE